MTNVAVVVGNLTRDLKINDVNGKTKVSGTVAVNYGKNQANFIRFEAWDKNAETLKNYCCSGSKVALNGYLTSNSWEKDGKKNYSMVLTVGGVTLIGSRDSKERIPDENNIAAGLPDDIVF